MGESSSNPIRCANQNMKEKTQVEGYVPRGSKKEKNPSRVSVIVKRVGLTSWLMESFSPFL
jgi:hypothetical protein